MSKQDTTKNVLNIRTPRQYNHITDEGVFALLKTPPKLIGTTGLHISYNHYGTGYGSNTSSYGSNSVSESTPGGSLWAINPSNVR